MSIKLSRKKIWLGVSVVLIVALFTCLYNGVMASAATREAYEKLKLFADVLDIVEKNYVEEVKTG
ncbi:MAG: hypothetical protein Q8O60_04055, partial [Deltaproteobacteria bacterium]|nr:hypothetical protein [Deltaproteobacteria bacterium]